MATANETWTVVIVAEDHSMNQILQLSPDCTVTQVIQLWRDEVKVFGNWVLQTDDRLLTLDEDFTLRMIGETAVGSRIVNLRIEKSSKPTPRPPKSIAVLFEGKFQRLNVHPNDRLCDILPGAPEASYEYNGRLLCLQKTVRQAKLVDDAVVSQCTCRLSVCLSKGEHIQVTLPKEATVCQLKAAVKSHEMSDFSLRYKGRILEPLDPIQNLRQTVEVCRTEIGVKIGNRCVMWTAASGLMNFCQFIGQLSKEADMDWRVLEPLTFTCKGCGRRFCKEEEEFQLLQTKCCRLQSLKLKAEQSIILKDIATSTRHPRFVDRGTEAQSSVGKMAGDDRNLDIQQPVHDDAAKQLEGNVITTVESCQTEETETVDASTQNPPTVPIHFALQNYTNTGPHRNWYEFQVYVFLDLPSPNPTVGQVRTAVAHFLERRPENTRMQIYLADTLLGSKLVHWIRTSSTSFYLNEDGEYDFLSVKNRRWEDLEEDSQLFPMPSGFTPALRIHPR